MTFIAGVDDAGRGPVLGPLIIAGILLESEKIGILTKLNVKDSKMLSPSKRELLYGKIVEVADNFEIAHIAPKTIDEYVMRGKKFQGLNLLEAEVMAKIVEKLKPDIAYIDASDIDEERYGTWISQRLSEHVEVVSKHHADVTYPIVSASSILAKVTRDREIEKLKTIYGDFGSGYSSDPKTNIFLKEYYEKRGDFPPFTRRSWKTLTRLLEEMRQTRL